MPKRDTLAHVRTFLGSVDPDYTLLQTALSFVEAPPKINGWKRNELRHWCLEQIRSISGTTTLEEGLRHADVRTLIAFGYLAFVRAPYVSPPATPSTPTPTFLKTLESDFFLVLLREIKSNARVFP